MKRVLEIIDFGFFSKLTVKQQWVLWGLAICLGAVLPFLGSLKNGYVIDDETIVANNPNTASLARTGFVFTHENWGSATQQYTPGAVYRPVTIFSFAVISTFVSNTPLAHHSTNLVLHCLSAVLAALLIWILTHELTLSGLAGVCFALHPIHTEPVNLLVGRAELLAFSGTTGSLLLFLLAGQQRKYWIYGAAWGAWLTGLLAKESAVLLFPLLGILIWWVKLAPIGSFLSRERLQQALSEYGRTVMGYLIPLGLYFGFRAQALGHPLGSYLASGSNQKAAVQMIANPLYSLTLAERWKTSVVVVGKMFGLHIWPNPLLPDYSFDSIPLVTTLTDTRFLASALALVGLGAIIWVSRTTMPLFSASLMFWLFGMLFFSNLFIRFGTVFGERLMYTPSFGFCTALAFIFWKGSTQRLSAKRLTAGILGVWVAGSVYIGLQHTRNFKSTYTAITYLLNQGAQRNAWAWYALGNEQARHNKPREAIAAYQKSLGLYPSPDTYDLVAMHFLALGEWNEAAKNAREATRLDPGWWPYHKRLAIALTQSGHTDEAIEELQTALKSAPMDALLHYSLASLLKRKGDLGGAEVHYQAALQGDRPMPGGWRMLGEMYLTQGRKQEALTAFRNFIQANPTSSETGSIQEQIRQLEKETPPQPKSEHP